METNKRETERVGTEGASRATGVPTRRQREDRGRWSSRKKREVVLRILGGEDLDALSRELRVAGRHFRHGEARFMGGTVEVEEAGPRGCSERRGPSSCDSGGVEFLAVGGRRVPEGVGAAPVRRRADFSSPGVAAHAGERSLVPDADGAGARLEGARGNDRRRSSGCVVGDGCDERAVTGEGNAAIFFVIDHCTCECLGIHAARRGPRFEALEPLRQAVREVYGRYAKNVATRLSLRHDHGSQYMSDDFQNDLVFLDIASSPTFVREPEGNGCVERFVRTLKEQLLWLQRFEIVEELRVAIEAFRERYNREWIVERHGYQSPSAKRAALKSGAEVAA